MVIGQIQDRAFDNGREHIIRFVFKRQICHHSFLIAMQKHIPFGLVKKRHDRVFKEVTGLVTALSCDLRWKLIQFHRIKIGSSISKTQIQKSGYAKVFPGTKEACQRVE